MLLLHMLVKCLNIRLSVCLCVFERMCTCARACVRGCVRVCVRVCPPPQGRGGDVAVRSAGVRGQEARRGGVRWPEGARGLAQHWTEGQGGRQ